MPKLIEEVFGSGDQSWLASAHGIANCRTETVDISAFTKSTHYPDGYLRSGLPVAKVDGVLVPYDSTEATVTGAGVLAGHLFTDQAVVGNADLAAPVLDHGRVKASKVPGSFSKPAAAAKLSATTIVYV